MKRVLQNAIEDLSAGLGRHRVWVALASEDIGDQHRRTTLGPLWLLINYLAFAGAFIFVFHGGPVDPTYAIYVATGLLVWFFIMETITSSVTLFVREESFIKGTTLPLSVYVMRAVLQSTIRQSYALAGCVIILLLAGVIPSPEWIWSGVGLLVVLAFAPAATICGAFLGAFFPDSQFIVSNLMRVGMFVTPVFWSGEGSGGIRALFFHYNPFTYFLELVRQPILGHGFQATAFGICVAITLTAWLVALLLLGSFRRKVALVV